MRVLMYCSGMAGACSSLSIASYLSESFDGTSFLVLTDLPVFGRFKLPANLDYIHIPRVAGGLPADQEPTSRIDSSDQVRGIRRSILAAAVESYDPHLVIVDRHPFGIDRELYKPLSELRRREPRVRIIAGLPDVLGEPGILGAPQWAETSVCESLNEVFDEVWLYGSREVFGGGKDPWAESPGVASKVMYTGYLRHRIEPEAARTKLLSEGMSLDRPLVLVTVGGGRDGYRLVDPFFCFLESLDAAPGFQTHVVCGPMMSTAEKKLLDTRAARLRDVTIDRFHKDLTPYVQSASVVVSTFGYNTACQILSFQKPAVVVPRLLPGNDELLRARALSGHGLVDMIHPDELVPALLGAKVLAALGRAARPMSRARYRVAPLDGLENIAKRIVENPPGH